MTKEKSFITLTPGTSSSKRPSGLRSPAMKFQTLSIPANAFDFILTFDGNANFTEFYDQK